MIMIIIIFTIIIIIIIIIIIVIIIIIIIIKSQGLQAFVYIVVYQSISTDDEQRLDFAIVKSGNLLLLELTVGFETNIKKNSTLKRHVINSYLLSYQISTKFIM